MIYIRLSKQGSPWQEVFQNKEDRQKGKQNQRGKGDIDLATLFTDKNR